MNRQMRQTKNGIARSAKGIAVLSLLTLALVACDGANQGVQIGTGQNPDPVVIDFPIAYIKSPLPLDDNGVFEQQDLREQITFDFGADLYYRDRASVSAEDVNITGEITQGLGALRDVEIDYDGSRLLFAMRTPFDPNLDEEDLPTWNIWQYTFATDDDPAELRRVIASDLTAEIGHDIMPKYLPDGRIVFASTRQTRSQAILLDEGKPGFPAMDEDQNEFAFNIHIMDDDGNNVEQLTFNQSHDLDPAVLSDGRIVFSRWDHAQRHDEVNLYRMNPDGTGLEMLYGSESHFTGTDPNQEIHFMQPREADDGRMLALIRPFTDTEGGGEVVLIDTPQYLEYTQPTKDNIGVLTGPAQEDATINEVVTTPGLPSPGGRYASVYPIADGTERMLVSWSQCRLIEILEDDGDPNTIDQRIVACTEEALANVIVQDPDNPVTPAPGEFLVAQPLYGIWMYDPRDNTQLPVVPGEEGFMFTEVVAADPKSAPPVWPDGTETFALDPTLADAGEAVLNIRNVYDFDGTAVVDIAAMADPAQTPADSRVARFLRIEKAVSIPDEDLRDIDNTAFGVTTINGMKEIVGYIPVEPDGSVMTKVPANTALMVSVLDDDGRRITTRHNNWISLRPGQEYKCQGCHVANNGLSHGRKDAFDSAYAGAQTAGIAWPNSDPQWFVGDVGETMAESRARITCSDGSCSSIEPSMNVIYTDVWTDPNNMALAPGTDISFLYTDMTTAAPTSVACQQDWQAQCRTTINYEDHIHPLWSQPRIVMVDDDNDPATPDVPLVDGDGNVVNDNCLNCHTPVNPADGQVRVPAGQLELQDGPSPDEPDHFHAYRELLVTDNLQEVQNGALVDVLVQVDVDIDGNPIFDVVPIPSPASVGGARASSDFFNRFEVPQDLHFNILSTAERRLIAEWLDVGAQYYNNPFDAPIN